MFHFDKKGVVNCESEILDKSNKSCFRGFEGIVTLVMEQSLCVK
jgi:hypothetical protein